MRLFSIVISTLVICVLGSTLSFAERIHIKEKLAIKNVSNIDTCKEQAVLIAKDKAFLKLAKRSVSKSTYTSLLNDKPYDVDCCVRKVKVTKKPKLVGGSLCKAAVSVWIDDVLVNQEIDRAYSSKRRKRKPTYVGVLTRLAIGRSGDIKNKGSSALKAAEMFEAELSKAGFKIGNVSASFDSFASQTFGIFCDLESLKKDACTKFVTYTGTIQRTLTEIRDGLKYPEYEPDLRVFKNNDAWILMGEVRIKSAKRETDGLVYLADAEVEVEMFNLKTGEKKPIHPISKSIRGRTKKIAIHNAMSSSIRSAVRALAEKFYASS